TVPSRSPNRDWCSHAEEPGASENIARIASGCAATARPVQESDALPLSRTDAAFVNEKFVNVAVNVATPRSLAGSPTLAHCTEIRHVGGGHDGHAPRPGHPTAEPQAGTLMIEQVHTRLHVHLIRTERPFVHCAARVADHFGPHAIDG